MAGKIKLEKAYKTQIILYYKIQRTLTYSYMAPGTSKPLLAVSGQSHGGSVANCFLQHPCRQCFGERCLQPLKYKDETVSSLSNRSLTAIDSI